jgi:hypothetical protein
MTKTVIKAVIPQVLVTAIVVPEALVEGFVQTFAPTETTLHLFVDARTNAVYCECHVTAEKLVALSTTDVPLDPEEQPEYRANREIVADHSAFIAMKQDAKQRRSFNNIVTEYTTDFDPELPLKIIGGQHRFESIKEALEAGVNEIHGVKVYFGLTPDQRLDAQLISNTVIAVPTDLYDRMQETMKGPELREWCQRVTLLDDAQDFADKRQRGAQITVSAARTFILNYFKGQALATSDFDKSETSPKICKSGAMDGEWEELRSKGKFWKDAKLEAAGREYAALIKAQRQSFDKKKKGTVDEREKALNYAILAGWAFTAGLLSNNTARLARHYSLKAQLGRDPLNAAALAKGKHASDAENYRGLGFRIDAKERGRFVELFYLQAEKGEGITAPLVDLAIKKYHAKQAILEVQTAEQKVG